MVCDPPATMTRSQPRTRWGSAVTLLFSIALVIVFSGHRHSLLTGAYAQPISNMGPLAVAGAATARTATKMYVQGGNHSGTTISQLFSLDLAVPWNTNMPAWKQLTNTGPAQNLFPAVFSADEDTMVTFHSGDTFAYRYSILLDRWSRSAISVPSPGLQGVGAVMDPDDKQVYLTGGYTSRNQISIYNFVTDSIRDATPLPPPAVALEARAYYGSVWSKNRKSIIYFGGYNETLQATVHSNVVTEYVPSTGQWQTLSTVGIPPAMRADHCMVISDDGTKIVIYGGTLSSSYTYTNDIYILDLMSMTWRQGVSGLVRAYSSCVLAGSQFIAWGGLDENKNTVPTTILIYDINLNAWINNYTPPPSYIDISRNNSSTNSSNPGSGGSNSPSGSVSTAPPSSSHVGAIAGGAVGGIAVVCAVVLFLIFRKRFGAHARTGSGLGLEGRDRKYPVELSGNDEELQNLRLQVQTQEDELELRRRLYQLQQEQQQLRLQVQSHNPYAAQPITAAAAVASGGTTTYGYAPCRNDTGATLHPHPYAQQQQQPYQQQFDPINSPTGPVGLSGSSSPMLPSYSTQPLPYQRDQRQGGSNSLSHSMSSSSSAGPSQSSAQPIYVAHPYRPVDGSPTPSYSLVSATNTIGSSSTSSQPPSRVNSSRHQQHNISNTQQQGGAYIIAANTPGGSAAQQGLAIGGEIQRGEPRNRPLQNPQVGARERG